MKPLTDKQIASVPFGDHGGTVEELDALLAWMEEWNTTVSEPQRYKNGRIKPKKKKPIDALAYVRPFEKPLPVWSERYKHQVIQELLEEEEKNTP